MSRQVVDALATGDNRAAETGFKDAVSAKIGDSLETRRKEIAGTFVKTMKVENETD